MMKRGQEGRREMRRAGAGDLCTYLHVPVSKRAIKQVRREHKDERTHACMYFRPSVRPYVLRYVGICVCTNIRTYARTDVFADVMMMVIVTVTVPVMVLVRTMVMAIYC